MMIPKSKAKVLGNLSDRGHSSLKYVNGSEATEQQQHRAEFDSELVHWPCHQLSQDYSSCWSLSSDLPSPSSGRWTSKVPSVLSLAHLDLLRTDSGNSSLSTVDSASSSASVEPHPDDSFCTIWENLLLINVYVPEAQSEFDITCSLHQTIWSLKVTLIERNPRLRDNGFNHGFFSFVLGHFLDEQLTLEEYANQLEPSERSTSAPAVRLEFLYKQRVKYGEVMSTLPLASNTRKKRKRSRLLSAVQNGNLEKVAKALVNCDPNFVDEASGETPLSLASASQSPASATLQQMIVAIVNAGALLDFRTKDGRTPLHVAVQKSNFVALKTLLDLGASPNYIDATGLTPLYYSVIYKSNPKLTQLLLYEHATQGITDQHGWQEVHHASKLGLVAHLEQLLFYGCDMNCRIVGSGNTPLHVSAINDQVECARILLLRGCDTSVVNNSHQNAHQVAVIAGNMALAELIRNHKPESVAPYRDKPRYNPARRPPPLPSGSERHEINGNLGSGQHHLLPPRPISPSLSQTTNHTTTTSSGVCCDDDLDDVRKQLQLGSNQNQEALDGEEEEEEEEEDEEEKNGVASSGSEDSGTFAPGMTVRATADYNSGDPSHMQLRRNDQVILMHSDHSPPTIAFQKLLLGRRVVDGKEGYFPACCVEKIRSSRHQNGDDTDRVEGRRDMKLKTVQSATLPTRGRRGARKCLLDKGVTRQYQDRTITLHRGSKGFGFVLRGAKDSSPILTKQLMQQGSSVPLIGLQYFDEIEAGGVADAAGLKRGDFLLAVNDVDVRHMSHEGVVQLIRQSGDKVTMTIATPVPKQLVSILKKKGKSNKSQSQSGSEATGNGPESLPSSQSQTTMSQSVYGTFGNKAGKAPPPAPPKRDPSTTLSTSRARARSLVVPSEVRTAHNMMLNETKTAIDQKVPDQNGQCASSDADSMRQQSAKVASIRARSSRRISSYELNEFISRQQDENKSKVGGEVESGGECPNGMASDLPLPSPPPPQDASKTTLSPPSSPAHSNSIQTSIVKVTLAKQPAGDYVNQENSEPANRSLTSFQPARKALDSVESSAVPQIPEPDYSSDEEEKKNNSEELKTGDESTSAKSDAQTSSQVKLTTTATVILKSTSPCPPEPTTNRIAESSSGKLFASKNIFDELREQSAKITNAARQRLINNRQDSEEERKMRRMNSQDDSSQPVSNVMRNVAELEKRLSISGVGKEAVLARTLANANDANPNLRMSKSCVEELTPNSAILKKEFSTLKSNLRQQHQQANQPDMRRNSAIISAIAEKVAAVNQLVAEQQTSTGSKSLNSSPVPMSMTKLSGQMVTAGSAVVVQKPIALLPTGSSATLTRRCVTVCEDPVKAIHLQQQQHQLRSQLASSVTTSQPSKPKHSSLAESTSSILKQSTKALRSQTSVGMPYSPSTESAIDVVPPPPEFAAATPHTIHNAQLALGLRQVVAPQKVYVQRQVSQSSSSPLTIQTSSGSGGHHHHHHHQLVSEMVAQQYGTSGGGHQAQHYHLHHHHANPVSLSSSAPTSGPDAHTLMRNSLMTASVNHPQAQSMHSAYEFTSSQAAPNKTTTATQPVHQHTSSQQTQQQLLYGQQQNAQQSQNQQLLLQQRALAVANAKLYQQQQQQLRPQSSTGHYNTLSTSKPQQIQYYVATSQNQQHPQYFATLSRHQHAQVQQQYLNSLSTQQQQMQQQQFATLTRHHQQQLQQHLQPMLQQNLNYSQLLQQRQAQQIGSTGVAVPTNARLVQVQSAAINRQTPPNTTAMTKVAYGTAGQMTQYQYQQQHQTQVGTGVSGNSSYARKSVVEWTPDDVQEWVQRIGMTEHRTKFEGFNGAKMLRLDNNSLANIGVRQQQHRIYLLEKLKQQIWQNHQ